MMFAIAPDFYGTRIYIEAEVDGDAVFAMERLADILKWMVNREDVIACAGEVGAQRRGYLSKPPPRTTGEATTPAKGSVI